MSVIEYQPIYKISEVGKVLKINASDVYTLINSGKLPYIVLGSKKVKGKDLEAFINSFPVGKEGKSDETQTA